MVQRYARTPAAMLLAAAAGLAFTLACVRQGVEAPADTPAGPLSLADGPVTAQNAPPVLVWKTRPRANRTTEPPAVSGKAPLTVRFNLCDSFDPDPGDSLNWQFHFGDSDEPVYDEDGRFNADAARVCRVEHTYAEGVYTATLAVTDKHLDDQAADVVALARTVQHVTVVADSDAAPPAPPPAPASISYSDSFTQGVTPTTQCTDWQAFQAQLTGAFSSVTIRGSNDPVGRTCSDPAAATTLCNALNTGTRVRDVACGGILWAVGPCGAGTEINANDTGRECFCRNPGYDVRPCIGNRNWGGLDGWTCTIAPDQTLEVICTR